jgi:hypothetical protein
MHTDIRASNRIRIHDPSVWVGEDSSYLRSVFFPSLRYNQENCLHFKEPDGSSLCSDVLGWHNGNTQVMFGRGLAQISAGTLGVYRFLMNYLSPSRHNYLLPYPLQFIINSLALHLTLYSLGIEITMFAIACHWSSCRVRQIHPTPSILFILDPL